MAIGGHGDGYGGTPYGGGAIEEGGGPIPVDEECDILEVGSGDIQFLDTFDEVNLFGAGAGLFTSGPGFFRVCSGFNGADPVNAHIQLDVNVPGTFTFDVHVRFDALPDDFADLVDEHVYIGAFSLTSSAAGVFISKDGLLYTGSVAFAGGDLVVASPTVAIPGSAAFISEGVDLVVRIVADAANDIAQIFVTPEADVGVTGHQLVAILPLFDAGDASPAPTQDEGIISVKSATGPGACATLTALCLSSQILISNVAPIADAGDDQAIRKCSVVKLDGSRSFDPEGADLTYEWRLVDAPPTSKFTFEGGDGSTTPLGPPTGFTDIFSSTEAATEHASNPFVAGDVLLVRGQPYTIVSFNAGPFEIVVEKEQIPDDISGEPFKILRNQALATPTEVCATFFPDVNGFFVFDLLVSDGNLFSSPLGLDRDRVLINVLDSPLPRGCNPNAEFVFDYLLSFWKLIEDADVIAQFWTALAQVAATELLTLWQVEYSKSLRDIQRTFNRRWLHYDLMLPEPVPDLTTIKTIWAGTLSNPQLASGVPGVEGKQLVVTTSEIPDAVTITFVNKGTVPIEILRGTLENQLKKVDPAFAVTTIENRNTGSFTYRILLDKPFTLTSDSDLPIFGSYPQFNNNPKGAGVILGTETYDAGVSLEGLGIEEDDILVLGRIGYRVAQLVDEPTDDFPFQRVLVKETIEGTPASWCLPGWVQSELLNFYEGLVDNGDVVEFEALEDDPSTPAVEQVATLVETKALGVAQGQSGRLAFDTRDLAQKVPVNATNVCLARVVRRHYVPIDELVVNVPTLTAKIVIEDDEETLRENVDYLLDSSFRDQPALRFQAGAPGDAGDVWEGARPPDRLWAEYTFVDNNPTIESNFGIPIGLTIDRLAELPDTIDYLSAVRGIWYAFYNGPKVRNVRIGVQILLGLPFAEVAGTIEEIRDDFILKRGRILIRDADNDAIVRSYEYPNVLDLEINPETGEKFKVGDTVDQFAPLVEGAEVIDYVKDPTWFEGLLNQGIFFEVQKFHTFLVRVDSAAFNLSALSLVQQFVQDIKPIYKNALYFIRFDVAGEGDEINITDQIEYKVKLSLFEQPCSPTGAVGIFDDPDPSGNALGAPAGQASGAWKNQFDTDADPGTGFPAFPTPDTSVQWAFDKDHLCPVDDVVASVCTTFPTVTADITNVSATEADFLKTAGGWPDVDLEIGDYVQPSTGSNAGMIFEVTDVSGFPGTFRGTLVTYSPVGGPPVTEAGQTIELPPAFDTHLKFDTGVREEFDYEDTTGPPIAVPVAGLNIADVGGNLATFAGVSVEVRAKFFGDQGDAQTADITGVNIVDADFAKTAGGWPDVDLALNDIVEVTSGLNAGSKFKVIDVSGFPGTFRGRLIGGATAPSTDTGASVVSRTPRYEVYVEVNSVEVGSFQFTDDFNSEVVFSLSATVAVSNTIELFVRPAGGTVTRSPNWSSIEATVRNVGGVVTAGSITGITRSGSTATATTAAPHGLSTNDVVDVAGADQSEYNGPQVITVTGASTFTYPVAGTPTTPATGTITYSLVTAWAFDGFLGAGDYCSDRQLSP